METIASCELWLENGSWRRMFMEGLSWVILGRVFHELLSLGLSRVYGLITVDLSSMRQESYNDWTGQVLVLTSKQFSWFMVLSSGAGS